MTLSVPPQPKPVRVAGEGTLPPVTVVMPVYNGEDYVAEAVESILGQTHSRLEFLIVDDGSTDRTPDILHHFASRDSRVRVVRQENRDQPATLNRALELATHHWVAIIDHDDVSLPDRLVRQLEMVARIPDARVIGTWAIEINARGQRLRLRSNGPTSADEFRALRSRGERVPLVHPSVLMHRPSILELGGYDPQFGPSADSELWSRVARHHVIVVVPEALVLYRIHRRSMSFKRMFEQREMLRLIAAREAARAKGIDPPTRVEFSRDRPPWHPVRWADARRDLFWYLRSHCLLALGEQRRVAAATYALAAAVVSPSNAVRLAQRVIGGGSPPLGQPAPALPDRAATTP